jgi:hypothetical protein
MLLWEVGSWGQGPFGNPVEVERSPLEAATKQQLVKTVREWENLLCPTVIREVCRTVSVSSIVGTSCKSPINPITNSNPVYSYSKIVTIWRRERGLVPNTSSSIQTALAAEAHLAEVQFLLKGRRWKFFNIPSKNSKTSIFQMRRVEFRTKVNSDKG